MQKFVRIRVNGALLLLLLLLLLFTSFSTALCEFCFLFANSLSAIIYLNVKRAGKQRNGNKRLSDHILSLEDSKFDQNGIFGFMARIFDIQPLFLQLDYNPTVIIRKQKLVVFIVKRDKPVDNLCGDGFTSWRVSFPSSRF